MKCDACGREIEKGDEYIFLDQFETIFCSDDCLLDWLKRSGAIIPVINDEECGEDG